MKLVVDRMQTKVHSWLDYSLKIAQDFSPTAFTFFAN